MKVSLKSLVGLGYHEGKTVLYDEQHNRYLIEIEKTKEKEMAQFQAKKPELGAFIVSVSLLVGILNRNIALSGWLPLLTGLVLASFGTVMFYRIFTPVSIAVEEFDLRQLDFSQFLNEAGRQIRILYTTLGLSAIASLIFSTLYLMNSEFVFLFSAIAAFILIPLLLGTKLEKRRRIINKLKTFPKH